MKIRHTQRNLASLRRRDGHTIDGRPGDCLRACVATILGIPDDLTVPHFVMASDWWTALRCWTIEQHGLDWAVAWRDPDYAGPATVGTVRPGMVTPAEWSWHHARKYAGGHALVAGHSPRGPYLHGVVGNLEGGVVWDPHPSRAGLLDVVDIKVPVAPLALTGYGPARLALPAGAA